MDGHGEGAFCPSSLLSEGLPLTCLYQQLALCISIINASGPPVWKNVKLPANRTRRACLHTYNALKKQSEGVALSGPDTAAVPKPRKKTEKAEKADKAVTTGGVKRKRGEKVMKSAEAVEAVDDEEDEGPGGKKAKTEDGEIKDEDISEEDNDET